jgi:hypothetical protein
MQKCGKTSILITVLIHLALAGINNAEPRTVQVARKPGQPWEAMSTRTLDDLPSLQVDGPLDPYGGLSNRKGKSTGFFHAERVGDRWWLVDPDGGLFLYKGVSSVKMIPTPGARAVLAGKFGNDADWASKTVAFLRSYGFNGLGAWSDTARLREASPPLVYTRIWNFMSGYGKKRGGTFQQPGHTGYPKDCIFVFDPAFESFCDEYARQLAAEKDDPWLLGHFSDNELPLKREALKNYLTLPENDHGRTAAIQWLRMRHGPDASAKDITPQDESDFLAVVVDRYFRIVSKAIRKYDPNHLFLGSRFYGSDLRYPEIFKAAGPHVDVVSVNYYLAWTPDPEKLAMWAGQSGRPVLITEWYAKGQDSGLANTGGAGWLVKTQRDRGLFYQNFTLALLESKVCVGWHWFKYIDNDPDDKTTDPSNRDSNKGILNNRYEPWEDLLERMKPIHERAYGLVDFFGRSK